MKTLERDELKELLSKNWMTHDGMWFYHCLQECGIEKTNRINRAAARSLAGIEVKRIQKAFGLDQVGTFAQVRELIAAIFAVVKAEFMKFAYTFPGGNVVRLEMDRCFAYEGMKRLGVAAEYECGIFERIEGWFAAAGLSFSVRPEVKGCLMHTQGSCVREITFHLAESRPGGEA